ncbi:MAG: class I SAM-dependent methyltransferase [Candidatus Rokubacteria bacterium]|nr:class I SAM-dependent methyltransferase [Candidatus Rokubacteria bacterium]
MTRHAAPISGFSSAPPPDRVSATFWALVVAEPLREAVVLDVGTGAGRIALGLAPLCRRVVGVDRDPEVIDEARRRAYHAGLDNTEFIVADADVVDYRALTDESPALVTAHLFLSDPLVEKSARALAPGGALAMVGFHVDQWKETGRPSRFAYDEARMRRLCEKHGFAVEHLSVEREVETFASVEQALAAAIGLQETWKSDGRWFRYIKFLEEGGRTLTRSHVIVKARKEGGGGP